MAQGPSEARGFRLSPTQARAISLGLGPCGAVFSLPSGHSAQEVEAALLAICQDWEILRTTYPEPAETPAQLPAETAEVSLEQGADQGRSPEQHLEDFLDSASGPGLTARLLAGTDQNLLLLGLPAASCDHASWHLLASLLGNALSGNQTKSEAPQYADIAEWMQESLADENAAKERKGFRELIQNHPSPEVSLATSTSEKGKTRRSKLVLSESATPTFVLACWSVLISRLSDRDSFLLGITLPGRDVEALGSALGYFERTLPLAVECTDEEESLAHLAARLEKDLTSLRSKVESWAPDLPVSPIPFRFVLRESSAEFNSNSLDLLACTTPTEPFQAQLVLDSTGKNAKLVLETDSSRFSESTHAILQEQMAALLEESAQTPNLGLSLLGPVQKDLLQHFACGEEFSSQGTVLDMILEELAKNPEAPSVLGSGGAMSHQELDHASAAVAHALADAGIGQGQLVGISCDRNPDLIVGLLGILRAGAAYVPLPPAWPADRLGAILQESNSTLVLVDSLGRAALPESEIPFLAIQDAKAATPEAPNLSLQATDPAYVLFTSGSTGKPKGVVVEHGNLAWSTQARLHWYQEKADRFLLVSSFAFDSSVAGIFWTMASGGALVLPASGDERDPARLVDLIQEHQVTHLLTLPTLWGELLFPQAASKLTSLRTVIVAGEACPVEVPGKHQSVLPGVRLTNEYGPTEGTVWCTGWTFPTQPFPQISIGKPIPGVKLSVLKEDGSLAGVGEPGELFVAGPGVARGYLHQDSLTAARFMESPHGFGRSYRTGDSVRWRSCGNLDFLGRVDRQVKIRGYRVEPEEVERVMLSLPSIEAVVVDPRADGNGGLQLAAWHINAPGQHPRPEDLRFLLASRLPEAWVPNTFTVLDSLPRLPNGKVDRSQLPDPTPLASQTISPATNDTESLLCQMWQELLSVEEVGIHCDFFELGGHSILSIRVMGQIREIFELQLPLQVLFEGRTVAMLAAEMLKDPAHRERIERTATLVLEIRSEPDDSASSTP